MYKNRDMFYAIEKKPSYLFRFDTQPRHVKCIWPGCDAIIVTMSRVRKYCDEHQSVRKKLRDDAGRKKRGAK